DITGALPASATLKTEWRGGLLNGVTVITGTFADGSPLVAIPNYARYNRNPPAPPYVPPPPAPRPAPSQAAAPAPRPAPVPPASIFGIREAETAGGLLEMEALFNLNDYGNGLSGLFAWFEPPFRQRLDRFRIEALVGALLHQDAGDRPVGPDDTFEDNGADDPFPRDVGRIYRIDASRRHRRGHAVLDPVDRRRPLTREGDLDRDRDRNRRAVQGGGLAPPVLHRPARLFGGFGIERARPAPVADGAVAEDDGRQFDDARHVPFQQARRIERLDLSNERRCRLLLSQDLLRT